MKKILGFVMAMSVAGCAFGGTAFNSKWSVQGKRVISINSVIRVNQIEVSRTCNKGTDEAHLHTVAAAERFRKAVSDAIPEAKVTWAFSWLALKDERPNYVALRKRVVEFHRQYGDEITFIPGAYFAPMYNSRAQTNRDLHDGLVRVSEMVGGGYRPHGVVAGFLAADNLRYLSEIEGIHVAQGTIWSQYGIDNGDGDGSICYPYYPSREHACKPAQGPADFIDCVNLDGWTCDFICARRFGFEGGANSRTGVGPIETYRRLGVARGLDETRAVVRTHFGENFARNGFGWVVVGWETSLVSLYPDEITGALTKWLKGIREEYPDVCVPLMSEFGEAWRREHPNNDTLDYRFVQRGTGVPRVHSEPNLELTWYMNKSFRLATLRDWQKNEEAKVIDFTRYDLPAKEPMDASVSQPSRNWSLINRINQKQRRPEDRPVPMSALTAEEQRFIQSKIGTFANPVIGPDWPDPTVWKGGDGWYYSVATHLSTVYRSRNLIDWEDTHTSPISEATRAQLTQVTRNLWAPSVVKIGDTWNLYISRFVSDAKCTIVALTSKTPQGPFVYRDVVIDSEREGILNAIDPYVLEAEGRVLMFFGSLADGVHAVELTKDGLSLAPGAKPVHVAGIRRPPSKRVGAYEGSYVMKRGKWWYLFVSGGHYGDHTYYLTVGRSTNVMGPYLDRAGQPLTAGKATATLASQAGDRFFGPGHNGDVFTSADGRTWMFYHSHDANLPRKSCRPCLLQELKWTPDGWPCFENGRPKIFESRFSL